jgi:hypothetical protein
VVGCTGNSFIFLFLTFAKQEGNVIPGLYYEASHHEDVLWSGDIATPLLTLALDGSEL